MAPPHRTPLPKARKPTVPEFPDGTPSSKYKSVKVSKVYTTDKPTRETLYKSKPVPTGDSRKDPPPNQGKLDLMPIASMKKGKDWSKAIVYPVKSDVKGKIDGGGKGKGKGGGEGYEVKGDDKMLEEKIGEEIVDESG